MVSFSSLRPFGPSRDRDAPRRYFRCKIFFPLIVLVVVWINVSYWILKGTKGQCERFRTCRLTREAKAGNLWPALLVGLYPSIAAGVVAGAMVPTLSKRIDSGDVVGANKALAERAAAGVRQQADEENTRDAEPTQEKEKKKSGMSYITGQLDRDTHKDLDTDAKVDLGVPSCRGAFTPSMRAVSRRGSRGWFLFRI